MKISVITPIYYGEKYLSHLCSMVDENAGVLKESKQAVVEYIIVNDTPDRKLPYIRSMDYENIEIFIIENRNNVGIHQSRVNALNIASGEYILFLDQDDEIERNMLKSHLSVLEDYSKKNGDNVETIDVVIGNGYRQYKDKKVPIYGTKIAMRLSLLECMYIYGTDMILSPGQCLVRKDAIPLEWMENIMVANGCDDFLLWLLMFQKKCKFSTNSSFLYCHREGQDNYSASSDKMAESFFEMCNILQCSKLTEQRKIDVLRRRYMLKLKLKKSTDLAERLKEIVKNLDVLCVVFLYKICKYF